MGAKKGRKEKAPPITPAPRRPRYKLPESDAPEEVTPSLHRLAFTIAIEYDRVVLPTDDALARESSMLLAAVGHALADGHVAKENVESISTAEVRGRMQAYPRPALVDEENPE